MRDTPASEAVAQTAAFRKPRTTIGGGSDTACADRAARDELRTIGAMLP